MNLKRSLYLTVSLNSVPYFPVFDTTLQITHTQKHIHTHQICEGDPSSLNNAEQHHHPFYTKYTDEKEAAVAFTGQTQCLSIVICVSSHISLCIPTTLCCSWQMVIISVVPGRRDDGLFMMAQAHEDVQNHTQAYASKAKWIHHLKHVGSE